MKNLLIGTVALVVLAACGGGNDGDAAPAPAAAGEPAAAAQDPAAAQAFVASLVAASSETAEPLALGTAPLATSETEEPKPL
jgi:hypothetical protein